MRIVPLVVAALALFLAACGADGPTAGGASTATGERPPTVSEPDPGPLYEVNATVAEDRTHGPMLCLGGVLALLGPQSWCGDIPLAGWDWDAVEGEKTADGTVSGRYHVVGRYNGESFLVTDVGPYKDDLFTMGTDADTTSPCPEPEGGWTGLEQATQNDDDPAVAYATSQPDYVTSWVTHLRPAELEFGPVILNVVFMDDRERHEAQIRKVWSGPLCVVERDVPTARELRRIRKEVEAGLDELGLRMEWSVGPAAESVVEIGVVVDVGGKAQAALDARYGPGVVRLIPALKPIS